MPRSRGLARKHALVWSLLVSGLLAASGIGAAYLAYRDTLRSVEALQREKAAAAAARIAEFIAGIEQPLRWVVSSAVLAEGPTEELRIELLQWLKRVPALSELRWIDADGRERVAVSRFALDAINSGRDWSSDARFTTARQRGEYLSAVYFLRDTEPYVSLSLAARGGPVLAAEVNLKFVWEVIAQVRHGDTGLAYVVDQRGRLLSHPDLSLVLRQTDMAPLPQVRAAISSADATTRDAVGLDGAAVLAAAAPIERLGWWVIAEQQRREALAPVARSIAQSAMLIALGVLLAVTASVALARRLVRPIERLQARAAAIGAGRFDERIDIDSDDELQALAQQFNRMAAGLQEIYATLEARIADRTQELAHANEAKSRFLAAASHDLRQPMHALGLFVGQLRAAESDAARRTLIGHIEESVGALDALLESLLDISRLDAGTVAVNRRPFALGPLLARLSASFAPAAQAKALELRARPTRAWVDSDPLLLERIVLNLLANAIRYTERGRVLIGCRRRGAHVELIVADTGIGIDDEHLPHVFREFYRVDDGAQADKGLGLGLAIVDRLARLLGHPVAVRSRPGRGTCFSVLLPRTSPQGERAAADAVDTAPLAGRRVLVIDDDAAIREAVRGQLAQWGCDVLLAADGDAALAAVRADGTPDLVIADLRLAGGGDGVGVAHRVREACGGAVPIVIVTGETEPERLRDAEASGWLLLSKPIRPARLRALLEHLLRDA
jgi:signal transduction histidine kinase